MDITKITDNQENKSLDIIGQTIVSGKNPYHTTDAYKENIKKKNCTDF
jgi:hypothetical protein